MRIAILGATSQIARDLIQSFATSGEHELMLFARRPETVVAWLNEVNIDKAWMVAGYADFHASQHFDAVMNFVGVGNPAQAAAMGTSIFEITQYYDELALAYVKEHPQCRYIFLSSGAAYGSTFDEPANENTVARIPINNLQPQDWYGVAKLYAECRHRAFAHLPIGDIRVFNYFSHTQDLTARFLMTDILRAIQAGNSLKTSPDSMVRDFLHPKDFHHLVSCILEADPKNIQLDCYSLAPIEKSTLLESMSSNFGLKYDIVAGMTASINATGTKPFYYSRNHRAASIGYQPAYSSLNTVLIEASAILGRSI
jgi:nucleoside-diphosphate-sugar epimerase